MAGWPGGKAKTSSTHVTNVMRRVQLKLESLTCTRIAMTLHSLGVRTVHKLWDWDIISTSNEVAFPRRRLLAQAKSIGGCQEYGATER
jgi:hypothetical protein